MMDLSWLRKEDIKTENIDSYILVNTNGLTDTLRSEIKYFFNASEAKMDDATLVLISNDDSVSHPEGYTIVSEEKKIIIKAQTDNGLLYGLFDLIRLLQNPHIEKITNISSAPKNNIRMLNHWDNFDGSIERGYAGRSIFYENNKFRKDDDRIKQYARMLASVGINAISINNVNVHQKESYFIQEPLLNEVAYLADLFRNYGIRLYLSVNFASPISVGGLETADPLDTEVIKFWEETVKNIYKIIPDFGGFVVKADSEGQPGPFEYSRTHVDGANLFGKILKKYGGNVFWRCFVYNHLQDWRDRKTDRARAAYDHFKPLDGKFNDNVILQIKNGPMDFQVREPITPLFGDLRETNQALELQITQEYTGQQKHLVYLVSQWKEILDFDTYMDGKGSLVQDVITQYPENSKLKGMAAVVNVGRDKNWTGHKLAQANLYGFGRLAWDPTLSPEKILDEWIFQTFSLSDTSKQVLKSIMLSSWSTYEDYTSPLGIGWMVEPNHHYGPNIDGYEYSKWGTYHFADRNGLGVDRTVATGSGYTSQYQDENFKMYENIDTCPEELLLFFHHVPYEYKLKSGKTVIQHIYDTHFEGYEKVKEYQELWKSLENEIDQRSFENVSNRLKEQLRSAREWKDQINTYFLRKSGISDEKERLIYP